LITSAPKSPSTIAASGAAMTVETSSTLRPSRGGAGRTARRTRLAPVAEALGGRGVTVRGKSHWCAVREGVIGRDRLLVIDVKVDPDSVPHP